MTKSFRRLARVVLLCALTSLVFATGATASSEKHGFGMVVSRDLARSTLVIGNTEYRVTPRTVFKNAEGGLITFETLEVFDSSHGLFSMDQVTKVEFFSVETSSGPELESVRVVEELPL